MTDLAGRLLAAIDRKQYLAELASTHTYDEAGVMEMEPASLEWQVRRHDGEARLVDKDGRDIASAAQVDLIDQTSTPIRHDHLAFMADNDPASVRRRCAAGREMVNECCVVLAGNGDSGRLNGPALARFVLARLARGYGIQPSPGGDHA